MSRQIRWTVNQVKRIRSAVSSYNAAVTRMEKSGKYQAVPNRTTVEREMGLIETADELRQREKELGRILVKNKKDATEAVKYNNVIVPKYLANEIKLAIRAINERRAKIRAELFGDFEQMTARERATRMANKNLKDVNEEYYTDGDDLDDLFEEKYPKTFDYANRYKSVWRDFNGDESVPEIIDWFAENAPEQLKLIFESGADEVDINYIYPMSADKTPEIIRHNNVVRFWNEEYRKANSGKGNALKDIVAARREAR